MNIEQIISNHELHLKGLGGAVADLNGANLTGFNFKKRDLSGANLRSANLLKANLNEINLSRADLAFCNFKGATLIGANLEEATLKGANLEGAILSGANLTYVILRGANLKDAVFTNTNLTRADLSGVKGLPSNVDWLRENFETDSKGVIVYKAINELTPYDIPEYWEIEVDSILVENVDFNRCVDCGCGVNFGTREWCLRHYAVEGVWRCRINWYDLADVVVPFNTDGKARCGRLELLEYET